MNKKLPNVFANPIQKKLGNVQETFYGENRAIKESNSIRDIEQEINDIFSSRNFVYKSKVEITTNEGTSIYTIVGRTEKSLLTIDGQVIPIQSILSVEKK